MYRIKSPYVKKYFPASVDKRDELRELVGSFVQSIEVCHLTGTRECESGCCYLLD